VRPPQRNNQKCALGAKIFQRQSWCRLPTERRCVLWLCDLIRGRRPTFVERRHAWLRAAGRHCRCDDRVMLMTTWCLYCVDIQWRRALSADDYRHSPQGTLQSDTGSAATVCTIHWPLLSSPTEARSARSLCFHRGVSPTSFVCRRDLTRQSTILLGKPDILVSDRLIVWFAYCLYYLSRRCWMYSRIW